MFNKKESLSRKDLENKIIFWDIDGTLAPYRFNGHVGDPNGTCNGQSAEEIEQGIFLFRKPSKYMQKILETCNAKEHLVMGHCVCEKEITDKNNWLDYYFPYIKNRLFAYTDISKADEILMYINKHNINIHDVLYVDDVIPFLREAESKGISSWHISSFLDYQF